MKKTMNVDGELLARARKACGAGTDTETVTKGLEALVREKAIQNLIASSGSEPDAQDVPRRRMPASRGKKRRAAAGR
ncbi:MAG: type II toxin-antitoxin system VapB family antitoxin [Terriglobales bacterium]